MGYGRVGEAGGGEFEEDAAGYLYSLIKVFITIFFFSLSLQDFFIDEYE